MSTQPSRPAPSGAFEYLTTKKDEFVGWARKFSLFPYPFVTACCAMEFMSVSSTLYDTDRFGAAMPRFKTGALRGRGVFGQFGSGKYEQQALGLGLHARGLQQVVEGSNFHHKVSQSKKSDQNPGTTPRSASSELTYALAAGRARAALRDCTVPMLMKHRACSDGTS